MKSGVTAAHKNDCKSNTRVLCLYTDVIITASLKGRKYIQIVCYICCSIADRFIKTYCRRRLQPEANLFWVWEWKSVGTSDVDCPGSNPSEDVSPCGSVTSLTRDVVAWSNLRLQHSRLYWSVSGCCNLLDTIDASSRPIAVWTCCLCCELRPPNVVPHVCYESHILINKNSGRVVPCIYNDVICLSVFSQIVFRQEIRIHYLWDLFHWISSSRGYLNGFTVTVLHC